MQKGIMKHSTLVTLGKWIKNRGAKMREIIVIRIISCKHPTHWYFDDIDCTVEVIDYDQDYVVYEDYARGYCTLWRHIEKEDCEVLSIKTASLDS